MAGDYDLSMPDLEGGPPPSAAPPLTLRSFQPPSGTTAPDLSMPDLEGGGQYPTYTVTPTTDSQGMTATDAGHLMWGNAHGLAASWKELGAVEAHRMGWDNVEDYLSSGARLSRMDAQDELSQVNPEIVNLSNESIFSGDFRNHLRSGVASKLIANIPSIAAFTPAAFSSVGLAVGLGGLMSAAAYADQWHDAIEKTDDQTLINQFPYYARLRAGGMGINDAKDRLSHEQIVASHGELMSGLVGGATGAFFPARQWAGAGEYLFGRLPAWYQRALVSGSEAGTATAVQDLGINLAINQAANQYHVGQQKSPSEMFESAMNQFVGQGVMGGTAGALRLSERVEHEEKFKGRTIQEEQAAEREEQGLPPERHKVIDAITGATPEEVEAFKKDFTQTPPVTGESGAAAAVGPMAEAGEYTTPAGPPGTVMREENKTAATSTPEPGVSGHPKRSSRVGRTKAGPGPVPSQQGRPAREAPSSGARTADDQALALQAVHDPTTASQQLQPEKVQRAPVEQPPVAQPRAPEPEPRAATTEATIQPPATPIPPPLPEAGPSPEFEVPVTPGEQDFPSPPAWVSEREEPHPEPVPTGTVQFAPVEAIGTGQEHPGGWERPQVTIGKLRPKSIVRKHGEKTATILTPWPATPAAQQPEPAETVAEAVTAAAARPKLRPVLEPGHMSKAQIAKRTSNNRTADEVVAGHYPTGRDQRALLPDEQGGIGARSILQGRLRAMLDDAKERGVTIPRRFEKAVNPEYDHAPSVLYIDEAKRFLDLPEDQKDTAAYKKFLDVEKQLMEGKYAERLEDRSAEAAQAMRTREVLMEPTEIAKLPVVGETPAQKLEGVVEGEGWTAVAGGQKQFEVERRKLDRFLAKTYKIEDEANKTEEPKSAAQAEAGNYPHGHFRMEGQDVSIEAARGQTRSGVDAEGRQWSVRTPTHYGYILGTQGADKEHLDVHVGPNGETGRIFVMNQNDPLTGIFDEHKVFMGYHNISDAMAAYWEGFKGENKEQTRQRMAGWFEMTRPDFKEWLREGDLHQPMGEDQAGQSLDGMVSTRGGRFAPSSVSKSGNVLKGLSLDYYAGSVKPFMHSLVERLGNIAGNIPIYYVDAYTMERLAGDRTTLAFYQGQLNHIVALRPDLAINKSEYEHNMIHEILHGATIHSMEADKGFYEVTRKLMEDAYKQLQEQGGYSKKTLDEMYAFTTNDKGQRIPEEFIAEALSNPEFQKMLKDVDISKELANELHIPQWRIASIWKHAVDFLRQQLGIANKPQFTSALEAAMAAGEYSMWAKDPAEQMKFAGRLAKNANVEQQLIARADNFQTRVRDPATFNIYQSKMTKLPQQMQSKAKDSITDWGSASTHAFLKTQLLSNILDAYEHLWQPEVMRHLFNSVQQTGELYDKYAKKGDDLALKQAAWVQKNMGPQAQVYYRLGELMSTFRVVPYDALGKGDNSHISTRPLEYNSPYEDWGGVSGYKQLAPLWQALNTEGQQLIRDKVAWYKERQKQLGNGRLEATIASWGAPKGSTLKDVVNRYQNKMQTKEDEAFYRGIKGATKEINDAIKFRDAPGAYFNAFRTGEFVSSGHYDIPAGGAARDINGEMLPENVRDFDTRHDMFQYRQNQVKDFHADPEQILYLKDSQTNGRWEPAKMLGDSKDPNAQYATRYQLTVENRRTEIRAKASEAETVRQSMVDEGLRDVTGVMSRTDPRLFQQIGSPQVDAAIDRLNRRRDLTQNQKEQMAGVLRDTMLAGQNARLGQTFMKRMNIKGAEWDTEKQIQGYNTMTSTALARMDTMPETDKWLKVMEDYLERNKTKPDFPTLKMSAVLNELQDRIYGRGKTVFSPEVPEWVKKVQTVNFVDTLLSPAHVILHGLRVPMQGLPFLGGIYGYGPAWRALGRSYRMITGNVGELAGAALSSSKNILLSPLQKDIQKRLEMRKGADFIHTMMNDLPKGSIQYKAMERLNDLGYFHKNAGIDLLDDTRGLNMRTVNEAVRELTGVVDTVDRFVMAHSAFELDRAAYPGAGFDHWVSAAQKAIEQPLGLYSPTNLAPWMRLKFVRPLMQFKTHPMQLAYLLSRVTYNAFKGATPEVQRRAVGQLTGLLVVGAAMSGINGLPTEVLKIPAILGMAFGFNTYPSLYSDEVQETLEQYLGHTMAQVFMNGFPSLLGGLAPDIHHRAGYSSLFTFGEPKETNWQSVSDWALEQVFSTPALYMQRVADGIRQIQAGNYTDAAVDMVPFRLFDDVGRAYNLATEGKPTGAGRPGLEPQGVGPIVTTMLGFTPQVKSEYAAGQHVAHIKMQAQKTGKSQAIQAIAKAQDYGTAYRLMMVYNKDNPKDPITGADIQRERKRELEPQVFGIPETKKTKSFLEGIRGTYGQ